MRQALKNYAMTGFIFGAGMAAIRALFDGNIPLVSALVITLLFGVGGAVVATLSGGAVELERAWRRKSGREEIPTPTPFIKLLAAATIITAAGFGVVFLTFAP